MPTARLCMRHTREILRHKWLLGSSHRLVTLSLKVSHGAITDTTQRAVRAGLDWDSVCALDTGAWFNPPFAGPARASDRLRHPASAARPAPANAS